MPINIAQKKSKKKSIPIRKEGRVPTDYYPWFTFTCDGLSEQEMDNFASDLGNLLQDSYEVFENGDKRGKPLYTARGDLGGTDLAGRKHQEAIEKIASEYIYGFEFDVVSKSKHK